MQPYQEEYVSNCQTICMLASSPILEEELLDKRFDITLENTFRVQELAKRNTQLLQEKLLPVLDDLFQQDRETLHDMEAFADALTRGPQALDASLACQIHKALLSLARHVNDREMVIRELYKLGMARYAIWYMLTGLKLPEEKGYTMRMRYCFVEASSYLKYFKEFSEETKAYILRSLANVYLGTFDDWRDKLRCVRHTMQVFTDPYYRENAPGLPWERYMKSVHQQMMNVPPYKLGENSLSPDEVADVMESAHAVYEVQYEQDHKNGRIIRARSLLPYYSLEFSCGLINKEQLIKNIEDLMDAANPHEYDENSNYQIISMMAFYVQYLKFLPTFIPPRQEYITHLYHRMLHYVETMPQEKVTDQTLLYVRQVLSVFLELEKGVTYRNLALALLARFAPELYAHGYAVGQMAQAICEVIIDGEPDFFDDIPEIAKIPAGEKKREAIGRLAYNAGLLHDVGKMHFTSLYHHLGRQLLHSEDELLHLHTSAGWLYLKEYDSTRQYADAAWGHHRWYDGSNGYPADYQRRESPYRAIVDVVAIANFLDSEENDEMGLPVRTTSFKDKLAQVTKLEGRRFSPLVTAWLSAQELLVCLEDLYETGRKKGYECCFVTV